jgi:hypothetical protein
MNSLAGRSPGARPLDRPLLARSPTGGFQPSPKEERLRSSKGKVAISDGPFTEAKELIGGFALLEAKSREEASKWPSGSSGLRATGSARFTS